MGLDTVDLVLEIEQTFGIAISDDEAAQVATVRDCYDLILSKSPFGQPARCLSSVCFYRLRRGLGDVVSAPRATVRLDCELELLIPLQDRRKIWNYHGLTMSGGYAGTEADVWETLCGLISEHLGVPLEKVTAQARFVQDLGAD